MAVGINFRMKKDIPNRYKYSPYFEDLNKIERKSIERKLRHSIKIYLKKG